MLGGQAKLYPFSELKGASSPLADEVAGEKVVIEFNPRDQMATVRGGKGESLPHFVAFLADARAFYPDAQVFKAKSKPELSPGPKQEH